MGQSELPMPTRGPVLIEHDHWLVDPDHDERFGVTSVAVNALDTAYIPCDQTATKESEANAHLIAAAFNAATAAADLGFDPIAALEALPELLKAIEAAGVVVGDLTQWSCQDPHNGSEMFVVQQQLGTALDAARTRGVTK